MKIGTQHRNKIWRSLVEFRNSSTLAGSSSSQTQALQRSSSNASTVSMGSQNGGATAYNPGFYEVTRYTFKHTISLKNDGDHDYC